jgi:hypothetical protein
MTTSPQTRGEANGPSLIKLTWGNESHAENHTSGHIGALMWWPVFSVEMTPTSSLQRVRAPQDARKILVSSHSNTSRAFLDYLARRLFSLSFSTRSFGLVVAPCSHRSICSTETACLTAGARTSTSSFVDGPTGSVEPSFFSAASPRAAASKRDSARTSTVWRMPRGSIKVTLHVWSAIAEERG